MSSDSKKTLVIEYWSRILLSTDFSISDISKIIILFAEEYEEFDPLLSEE